MKHGKSFQIIVAMVLLLWAPSAFAAFKLGFIGDEGTFGDHNTAAYEWASGTFSTTIIAPGDLDTEDLAQYGVLWWHDGDTDPTLLISDAAIDALQEYVQAGGSLLLSAAAEQLATTLEFEPGVPRAYGPGADGQAAGVTIRDDTADHPVWEGFNVQAGDQIQLTSVGYPMTSDYWSLMFEEAVTIADTWETGTDYGDVVGAFVEWRDGGIVFGIGWRIPHWAEDNDDRATLEQLTANVINYLASTSAFAALDPAGKLAATWGEVRQP